MGAVLCRGAQVCPAPKLNEGIEMLHIFGNRDRLFQLVFPTDLSSQCFVLCTSTVCYAVHTLILNHILVIL